MQEIVRQLQEIYHTEACNLFRQLIDERIAILREKNDLADTSEVLKNQGAISELKVIRSILTRQPKTTKQFDGAFV